LLLIVAITGMPGAGKSTAAEALVDLGWKRVVMGDIIREETVKRGLEPNSKNNGAVMKELREKRGPAVIAELCLSEIKKTGSKKVVVDGIRSIAEVEYFKKEADVLLVAVHASQARRYGLLRERGRSDDPLTEKMFLERDRRELEVGIGEAIALADEMISNQHKSPNSLASEIEKVVERWEKGVVSRT
jgi:dephospho-CoA kinase